MYDVEKCVDALWVEECVNDLFDAGLDNDKLVLLYLENPNANIAVKTLNGKSNRLNIKNAGHSMGHHALHSHNGHTWPVSVQ